MLRLMKDYLIRPAGHGDKDAISSVAIQSWNYTYNSFYPQEVIDKFVSRAYSHENLRNSIDRDSERPVRLFHVALDLEENIVGYSHSFHDPENEGSFELLRIYALPSAMGTGVGTALLSYLFSNCPGIRELTAWVEKKNIIGIRFYEKHGFKVSDEREIDLFGHKSQEVKYKLTR